MKCSTQLCGKKATKLVRGGDLYYPACDRHARLADATVPGVEIRPLRKGGRGGVFNR